LDISGWTGQAD